MNSVTSCCFLADCSWIIGRRSTTSSEEQLSGQSQGLSVRHADSIFELRLHSSIAYDFLHGIFLWFYRHLFQIWRSFLLIVYLITEKTCIVFYGCSSWIMLFLFVFCLFFGQYQVFLGNHTLGYIWRFWISKSWVHPSLNLEMFWILMIGVFLGVWLRKTTFKNRKSLTGYKKTNVASWFEGFTDYSLQDLHAQSCPSSAAWHCSLIELWWAWDVLWCSQNGSQLSQLSDHHKTIRAPGGFEISYLHACQGACQAPWLLPSSA